MIIKAPNRIILIGIQFMAKKIEIKTQKTKDSVVKFISSIKDQNLKGDCQTLLKIFKKATGQKPKMWGPSIIGFGETTYSRANGDTGQILATGFSPRKSGPVLYILPSHKDYSALLKKLGPHKMSKACLYLKSLENIDLKILEKLVLQGYKDNLKHAAKC